MYVPVKMTFIYYLFTAFSYENRLLWKTLNYMFSFISIKPEFVMGRVWVGYETQGPNPSCRAKRPSSRLFSKLRYGVYFFTSTRNN